MRDFLARTRRADGAHGPALVHTHTHTYTRRHRGSPAAMVPPRSRDRLGEDDMREIRGALHLLQDHLQCAIWYAARRCPGPGRSRAVPDPPWRPRPQLGHRQGSAGDAVLSQLLPVRPDASACPPRRPDGAGRECIERSLGLKPECPLCKIPVTRRSLNSNVCLGEFVQAFYRLLDAIESDTGCGADALASLRAASQSRYTTDAQDTRPTMRRRATDRHTCLQPVGSGASECRPHGAVLRAGRSLAAPDSPARVAGVRCTRRRRTAMEHIVDGKENQAGAPLVIEGDGATATRHGSKRARELDEMAAVCLNGRHVMRTARSDGLPDHLSPLPECELGGSPPLFPMYYASVPEA